MAIHADAFVHGKAMVDEPCVVGAGSRVWAFAHVMKDAVIGERCNVGEGAFVEGGVTIGNGCTIKNGVALWSGVTLADHVFVGPCAVFTNDLKPRSHPDFRTGPEDWLPTPVGEGATIGANATIVCGSRLGAWCFVGAGAVVARDVPDHGLVIGVPGRMAGWVCRCCERLPDPDGGVRTCRTCGRRYSERADGQGLELAE